ncbi:MULTISPECIES: heparinase II/III domain-containing protein [unclassified Vibrio]|uniref:heparinase II/III domain-containing protein n=1 Tax=unclassified Vibrio TaxID=2614977 RepID=UPI00187E220D|nr:MULTISPECIES: heparinase II/III family protein [unclassified Vibrio]EGX6961686.1 alginate lyase family protein [Vibrio alginolyticus]EJL6733321.1 heparinase II/III family protein [Vibrio alginolyticus]EJX2554556.1 heparinase II/III family protein [Vibrio alginolyticus]ELA6659966.1 heparinase II/III family protein [Vibrio alginolyticus]ELA6790235.1 heparinase II/III family protein [Vibrio alginolyticus]
MTTQPILLTEAEVELLRKEVGKPSLMGKSIEANRKELEAFMRLPLDVPGHGEAGGYEHNRHKQNYTYMNLAGRLFLITQEEKYAQFVKDLLAIYAEKYLTFDFHVQKNTNPTGRLFHQILNEHCWLMFTSLAYSCVASVMTEEERTAVVERIFEPMLDMFTVKYAHDFDRIHNHGIWAVAAVGICGLAIGKPEYLEMSVYGQDRDDTGGFLAQISQLFAPSGYYMEGPYYHRYAIRPTCVFAEVVHRHMPEVDIYNYKDKVIGNTVQAMLATAYPNGEFPALNDASRTMSITDMGVQVAVSVYSKHYGMDDNILGMAKIQNAVWMHPCGLELSQAYDKAIADREIGMPFWPSVELNEGPTGNNGAQGFIRMQDKTGDVSQLVMNYGQHGMGHGNFDTLGITFFNRGQEVLREYGFCRWVNVEPKFGGRYLDENKSYARQTIAHNAVTIDEQCQNGFDVDRADSVHGLPHFFKVEGTEINGMSAFANDHYPNTDMQRSVFMLNLDELEAPLLLDLYRIEGEGEHQYDYSHQYDGQIVRTNFDYQSFGELSTLGDDFGYQHLWKVASGKVQDTALVSWLQNNTYYTWLGTSSSAKQNGDNEVIFTRTGANDPSFNLRSEPAFILRSKGESTLFASVLETHGYFNEEFEQSVNARGQVKDIRVVGYNAVGSIVEITTEKSLVTVMISNVLGADDQTPHQVELNGKTYSWNGFYSLEVNVFGQEK